MRFNRTMSMFRRVLIIPSARSGWILSSRLLSKNLKIKIYRTIILSVVLARCETWSLTLREERKLRVFENMVLRRIFGPRREEVTEEWRKCITRS